MVRSFGIIPAAGLSRRMGRPKLLMPWGQGCVIDHVLQAWCESDVSKVLITVRADDELLLEQCRGHDVEVVILDPAPLDMKASVQGALEFVGEHECPCDEDVWMLAPADMPRLSTRLINHVLHAHEPASPAIVAPEAGSRKGHPVLFPWKLAGRVHQLAVSEGIRELWNQHAGRTIAWEDGISLDDIDTPDDYNRLRDS